MVKLSDCVFCQKNNFVVENELAGAFFDINPVRQGHLLIISKQHYETFFELPVPVRNAMFDLAVIAKKYLDDELHPAGYNLGVNVGAAGGQTVMHCHIHLIPRYQGDVINPAGGIRNLLPPAQNKSEL